MPFIDSNVREAYERLQSAVKGFADSPNHRDDVMVYALNRLPPKYVVTEAGKAITEVSLDGVQHRTAIDVQVLEAMKHVALKPRG
jgi:propanediol dehydratase small subunit